MAKKNVIIEEPAVEQAANGLKEMNTEVEATPVASPAVEEAAPVAEEEHPNRMGLRTRIYRAGQI